MTARDANEPTKARRQDVWRSNNTCMICQDLCKTREEKDKHEQQVKHKKKLVIYEFFATEVPKFQPFSGSSVLVKRYTACGEQYVGLECLHELHFSFASEPWWACSICYESGALLEQADMHLSSMNHITTYLDEFHSHKMLNLNVNGDPLKVYEDMKRVCKEVLEEEEGECTPPECIVMDASITKTDAMAKLAIDSNRCKPSYILHTDCTSQSKQPRKILQCSTCHQLIACDSDLLNRIWKVHELSPSHRQAVAIMMVLEQFDVTFESGYDEVKPTRPFKWKIVDDVYHGPMCGIEYLIVFNKGSFCELCGCAVKSVEDHFTCESHIMQFLTITFPTEMFRISQYAPDSRRTAVLGLTASPKFRFGGGLHKKVNVDWFPPSMEMMMKPEVPSFPSLMPELSPLGIDCQCLFCPICWRVVSVPKHVYDGGKALWSTHCAEQSHFEFAIKRACFGFDEKFFIPMSSSIQKAPSELHGKWTEIKEDKETATYIQTQGDVGLEFVVDDLENEEVVCILCAQWFARGMQTMINNHIRSYKHLIHYLHVTNRNLLSMLRVQKTEEASRELVLEWLQRSLYNDLDEMRLYSPEAAQRMRRWGNITIRKVDATAYDPIHRPVFECVMEMVDEVAKDDAEKAEVSIKEALAVAAVKVHSLKKKNGKVERVLCRCTQCEMAFSTTVEEIISNVWDRHLSSDQHFRRFRVLMSNKLDMLGFTEEKSTYTVKPFVQPDPTRKVSWQWNAKEKTHEFVLSVIGLEDLVERRSSETLGAHPPDFFCRLCAVVIPRRSAALEAHVHSAQHVLCYVHKYHPQTIMELDVLPKEGGKEMRRIIAQLLKDHQLKEPYCIPIYDPVGEQERKGIVALQTAQERERQRVLAEARKQAQEQRKKMDEERRKQRELQAEREKAKQAERAQRERELKERSERLQREKLRAQKRLDEAKRKVEEERKAQEEKEAEGAERKRRQDELRALLDQEKQRLKAMQEKEATQRRLMEEKDKLERKMQELKERAHQSPHTHRLASPHMAAPAIGVVNAPQLRSYREPMGMVPPNALPYSVSPSPFDAPASVRETLENIGPKPMFPEFVPVANKVPVYKGMEEADRAIRLISPEPRPEVVDRPSLRDRKVDPYIANSNIIQTREQLVDFLWRQGAERIPAKELPELFNEKATGIEGALGVDCLYEVICADCSDLDTFYCSMCGVWTTPSDMFKHLETTEHKLAYLFRNYKMYHQTVVSETNSVVRSAMLSQFAIQIWKMEKPPGVVSNRLRSLLDRATIERIWPEHVDVLDNSWKTDGGTMGRVDVPPPVSKSAMMFPEDQSSTVIKKEPKDDSASNGVKHSSRSKDKDKDKSGKSDSRSSTAKDKEKDRGSKGISSRSSKSDGRDRERSDRSDRRHSSNRDKETDKSRETDRRKETSAHSRKRSPPVEVILPSPTKEMGRQLSETPDRKRRRSRSPQRSSGRDARHSNSSSSREVVHTSSHSNRRESDRRRSSSRDRSYRETASHSSSRRRSRSRSPRDPFAGTGMTWEETAAAFLAKLGDSQAAASVLDPSKDHRSTSSRARELEEKLEQLRQLARAQPTAPVSMVVEELLEGSSSRRKAPVQHVEEVDEKAQMRKLLGVLITMQQEAERNGRVDESLVDRLYREVGLKKSVESTSDQLLAQLCSQISQEAEPRTRPSIDLQSFGIGLQNRSEDPPVQPSPSIFGGGFRPRAQTSQSTTFQTLLSDVKRSLDSFNRPTRSNSPLIKPPFVITNRDEVFPESETKSYVYPGADSQTFNQPSLQSERPSDSNLTKKEKAALRRKQLLEEAERLRKEAEEEDEEEDDWDCLVEVINQPAPTPTTSSVDDRSGSLGNSSGRSAKGKSQQQKSGGKKDVKQASGRKGTSVPLVPGQKMPLARTILPNGQSAEDAKAKRREEEREKEREKRKEKDKEGINEKDQGAGKRNVHGTPSSWPQPVPQPLLGINMSTSSSMHEQHQQQSQQQSNFQQPLHVPMMGNEPVYCNSSNAPVYPNPYVSYQSAQPQQFPGPQFFHGQPSAMGPPQSQQFVPGFEFSQMQQQQFYGHPPYYG
uniref:C2H2-type domain-containing protein n=1 Tax=Haemonchus contortus TaxID=6289 RepID=A0A7I4YGU3_HAECO